MTRATEAKRITALDAALSLLFALGLANFGWHAIQGEYGVFALVQFEADAAALEARLDALRAERLRLERLTGGLSGAAIDLDLLDERARAVLGHMRADEITPR